MLTEYLPKTWPSKTSGSGITAAVGKAEPEGLCFIGKFTVTGNFFISFVGESSYTLLVEFIKNAQALKKEGKIEEIVLSTLNLVYATSFSNATPEMVRTLWEDITTAAEGGKVKIKANSKKGLDIGSKSSLFSTISVIDYSENNPQLQLNFQAKGERAKEIANWLLVNDASLINSVLILSLFTLLGKIKSTPFLVKVLMKIQNTYSVGSVMTPTAKAAKVTLSKAAIYVKRTLKSLLNKLLEAETSAETTNLLRAWVGEVAETMKDKEKVLSEAFETFNLLNTSLKSSDNNNANPT